VRHGKVCRMQLIGHKSAGAAGVRIYQQPLYYTTRCLLAFTLVQQACPVVWNAFQLCRSAGERLLLCKSGNCQTRAAAVGTRSSSTCITHCKPSDPFPLHSLKQNGETNTATGQRFFANLSSKLSRHRQAADIVKHWQSTAWKGTHHQHSAPNNL
jgi:hypothetical protein